MHWIDTHCHLDAPEFSAVMLDAKAQVATNNIVHCVLPAVQVGTFQALRTLAHAGGHAYCLGIHPLYVARSDADALDQLAAALAQHRSDPRLVAVGEIGLDYFVPTLCQSPWRERQQQFYLAQLKLARQFDLPVVLHSRRAVEPVLQGLRSLAGPGRPWQGIAHAFNGSVSHAHALAALGLKLGFGGALTFERALHLRRLAASLPLTDMVLETDAPDMPPRWLYRTAAQRANGEPQGINTPAELPRIGAELASLRAIGVEQLAAATVHNALQALPRLRALPQWSKLSSDC
ncbi:putative deoxyribonuclease YjjV [mine drainage metagenome]|uniref:Putative deoxyribonuclease YjjV n=1 Tax=mine drainage metagenome TaxID=410659 RepID=A0A1J5Q2G4_9ZZZZ